MREEKPEKKRKQSRGWEEMQKGPQSCNESMWCLSFVVSSEGIKKTGW